MNVNKYLSNLDNSARNLMLKGIDGSTAETIIKAAAERGMSADEYLGRMRTKGGPLAAVQDGFGNRKTFGGRAGIFNVRAVRASLAGTDANLGALPFFIGFPASDGNNYQDIFARFCPVQGLSLTVTRGAGGSIVLSYSNGVDTSTITVTSATAQFNFMQKSFGFGWKYSVDMIKVKVPAASLGQLNQSISQAVATPLGLESVNSTTPGASQNPDNNITNLVSITELDWKIGAVTGIVHTIDAGVTAAEGVSLDLFLQAFDSPSF